MRRKGMSRLVPGSAFGKFVIARELGRGGMGIVYLAEDTDLQRRVALKVVRDDFAGDARFCQRLKTEARAAAQLAHPNIVHVYGLHELDGALAIESEFASGGSMLGMGTPDTAAPGDLLHPICQVLDALSLCHREGVVHRDIKPSNILFDHDGNVKLTDFGLAHAYDDWAARTFSESVTSCVWATPRYAPPEAWDDAKPTPAWDVFSVGIVMYERLSGRMPWEARSALSLIQQMSSRDLEALHTINRAISVELSHTVSQMLAIRPDERPGDAAEALQLIRGCPEFQSVAGKTRSVTSTARRSSHFSRPSKSRARVVAIIGVVALLASVAWSTYGNLDRLLPRAAASRTQFADTVTERPKDIDAFLDATNEERSSVFSVAAFGDAEGVAPTYWLVRQPDNNRLEIVGYSDRGLFYWSGSHRASGVFSGSGEWAEYRDDFGSVLRSGRVEGEARWIAESVLSMSCTFDAEQTDARWEATIVATSEAGLTRARFVHSMESARAVQALLFNEMTPRRSMIPAVSPLLCAAQPGGVRVREISGACDIDGRLDESFWLNLSPALVEEGFAVRDATQASGSFLMVLRHGDRLTIGTRAPAATARAGDWRIRVAVVTRYAIPVTASERFTFQVDSEGQRLHESWVDGKLHPIEVAWEANAVSDSGACSAELCLPISALAAGGGQLCMRIAVVFETVNDRGVVTPFMWFGYPDPSAPWHGLPLNFAPGSVSGV